MFVHVCDTIIENTKTTHCGPFKLSFETLKSIMVKCVCVRVNVKQLQTSVLPEKVLPLAL